MYLLVVLRSVFSLLLPVLLAWNAYGRWWWWMWMGQCVGAFVNLSEFATSCIRGWVSCPICMRT